MSSIYASMGILSKTLSLFGKGREIAPAAERRAELEYRGHHTEVGDAKNEQAVGKEVHLSMPRQDPIQHDAEPESEVTVVAQHDEQIADPRNEQAVGKAMLLTEQQDSIQHAAEMTMTTDRDPLSGYDPKWPVDHLYSPEYLKWSDELMESLRQP